jgi:DNA-directed RNA polymerase alpha subunit
MNLNGKKTQVCVLNSSEHSVKFVVNNIHYGLLNAIRGVLLEEIPCFAFHAMRFECNRTILVHEKILDRLRLIPMDSTLCENLLWTCDCDCNNQPCEKCSIQYTIDVTNETDDFQHVTTADLVQVSNVERLPVKPLAKITIVTLAPGQRLAMTAHLQKGIGRDNGKWVCVTKVGMQGVPLITANTFASFTSEQQQTIVDACPKKVFGMNKQTKCLEIEDLLACTACDECMIHANKFIHQNTNSQASKRRKVSIANEAEKEEQKLVDDIEPYVKLSDDSFIFTIDSDGRLPIRDIIQTMFRTLKQKVTS